MSGMSNVVPTGHLTKRHFFSFVTTTERTCLLSGILESRACLEYPHHNQAEVCNFKKMQEE
eukprot:2596799-Amphidinium_carterae.1